MYVLSVCVCACFCVHVYPCLHRAHTYVFMYLHVCAPMSRHACVCALTRVIASMCVLFYICACGCVPTPVTHTYALAQVHTGVCTCACMWVCTRDCKLWMCAGILVCTGTLHVSLIGHMSSATHMSWPPVPPSRKIYPVVC